MLQAIFADLFAMVSFTQNTMLTDRLRKWHQCFSNQDADDTEVFTIPARSRNFVFGRSTAVDIYLHVQNRLV